jgi:hypothetical protein
VVLLLYPDEGVPGFVEVATIGKQPSWPVAAEQLLQRVKWDLGDEASRVQLRALSLQAFCDEASHEIAR